MSQVYDYNSNLLSTLASDVTTTVQLIDFASYTSRCNQLWLSSAFLRAIWYLTSDSDTAQRCAKQYPAYQLVAQVIAIPTHAQCSA
jgi:hypothetical protein